MNKVHPFRCQARILVSAATALMVLCAAAPAAIAVATPTMSDANPAVSTAPVYHGTVGMPGWHIALIAGVAAVLAAVVAVAVDRARAERRQLPMQLN